MPLRHNVYFRSWLLAALAITAYIVPTLAYEQATFGAPVATNFSARGDRVEAADVNGDGRRDLVFLTAVTMPEGGLYDAIQVLWGGSLAPSAPIPIAPINKLTTTALSIGDVNRDGAIDIVVSRGDGMRVFTAGVQTAFEPQITVADAMLFDMNGDGWFDVVGAKNHGGKKPPTNASAGIEVWWGSANASYSGPTALNTSPDVFTVARVNGDARPDVVVFNYPYVTSFLNAGDGSFSPNHSYGGAEIETELLTLDTTGDGVLDLVFGSGASILTMAGDSLGGFLPPTVLVALPVPPGAYYRQVTSIALSPTKKGGKKGKGSLAGLPDLLITSYSDAGAMPVMVAQGLPGGGYGTPTPVAFESSPSEVYWAAYAGDVVGNEFADLMVITGLNHIGTMAGLPTSEDYDDLLVDLQSSEAEVKSLQQQNFLLEGAAAKLQGQVGVLNARIALLETEKADLERDLAILATDNVALRLENAELRAQAKQHKAELALITQQLAKANAMKNELIRRLLREPATATVASAVIDYVQDEHDATDQATGHPDPRLVNAARNLADARHHLARGDYEAAIREARQAHRQITNVIDHPLKPKKPAPKDPKKDSKDQKKK